MKIAIIGTHSIGGGSVRIKAYYNFLKSKNHHVDIIEIPDKDYASKIWYFYQKAYARFKDKEPQLLRNIADKIDKKIRRKNYDIIIGVETKMSYVLTRNFNCLKLFSCESIEADQLFFSTKGINLERIKRLREMELEIMMKSDYVIFPWKTTENYVTKYVWNGDNFITIKYGCYPQSKTVSYFFPTAVISLGNLYGQWTNKELLSYLTKISPHPIHVYGKFKPERKYHLNYKGYAPTLDILYNYQFGINTVSKDLFRQNHHSSRIMSYLAYGLPVLSPEWHKFSKELKGCLSFNEDNFVDLVEEYSDREKWGKLSKEAVNQGRDLDWKNTLLPLEQIISGSNIVQS